MVFGAMTGNLVVANAAPGIVFKILKLDMMHKALKQFVLFITRRKMFDLQHPRAVRFELQINRSVFFECQIDRKATCVSYVTRRPRFTLNIDPIEV